MKKTFSSPSQASPLRRQRWRSWPSTRIGTRSAGGLLPDARRAGRVEAASRPTTTPRSSSRIYWAKRDPNPATPPTIPRRVCSRRIAAADEQFKMRRQKGSESSRGRLFVVLGTRAGSRSHARQAAADGQGLRIGLTAPSSTPAPPEGVASGADLDLRQGQVRSVARRSATLALRVAARSPAGHRRAQNAGRRRQGDRHDRREVHRQSRTRRSPRALPSRRRSPAARARRPRRRRSSGSRPRRRRPTGSAPRGRRRLRRRPRRGRSGSDRPLPASVKSALDAIPPRTPGDASFWSGEFRSPLRASPSSRSSSTSRRTSRPSRRALR